jgi:hypothetical protein
MTDAIKPFIQIPPDEIIVMQKGKSCNWLGKVGLLTLKNGNARIK